MSDIQDLGRQLSKLTSDINATKAYIAEMAKDISKATDTFQYLTQGTARQNYKAVVSLLFAAQNKLNIATANLSIALDCAKKWLDNHVVNTGSPLQFGQNVGAEINEHLTPTLEKTPFHALEEYMCAHNYGDNDYNVYSKDPVWRALHKAAFPECELPPVPQTTAYFLLTQYMSEHNYGIDDYSIYSQDPVWQELHKYAFPAHFSKPDLNSASQQYSSIVSVLEQMDVSYRNIQLYGQERSEKEIVKRLGGGDNTEGSCSSLAFAYIGNIAGYDVLDFRDGQSRKIFSKNSTIETIATLPGVDSHIVRGLDDIVCTNSLLRKMIPGKEYYLATGLHASIVRRIDDIFEYLELQHPTNNGWHLLDNFVLHNRFRCSQSNSFECPNFLIDILTLAGNSEFLGVLGYLNTSESEQRKGENGYVR